MKLAIFILLMIFPLFSNEADELLTLAMNRLKGIDQKMVVTLTQEQKGKPPKEQKFHSWTHWNSNEKVYKMVKILIEKPKELEGISYWIHKDTLDVVKKWMTMPITGKLKDISGESNKKDEFDFSELEISRDDIDQNSNKISGKESVNNRETMIIESTAFLSSGEIDIVKKIWIDKKDYFIHKAVFQNRKGRVIKQILLSNPVVINNITLLSQIKINNFRKKININISLSDISFANIENINIFIPRGK